MQILIYAQQLGNDSMVGWRGYFEDILGQVKKIKTAMFTKTIIYGIIYPNETNELQFIWEKMTKGWTICIVQ